MVKSRASNIRIERKWAMSSAWTFRIPPIRDLVAEEMGEHPGLWVDPCCGKCSPAAVRNDLDKEREADYHFEALEFLKQFQDESVDGVLFDPPYSLRQIVEHYNGCGRKATKQDTSGKWHSDRKNEIARILCSGGKVICCGWNSAGLGKRRGFELTRVMLVAHGGSKNDTIVTVETKRQSGLKFA